MRLVFNSQKDARVGKGLKPKSRFWTGPGCVRGQHGLSWLWDRACTRGFWPEIALHAMHAAKYAHARARSCRVLPCSANWESFIPCYMFHTEKSENALAIFYMALILFNFIIYRPFKNYSSAFHIIAKQVDTYIVVGDTRRAISIIVLMLTR